MAEKEKKYPVYRWHLIEVAAVQKLAERLREKTGADLCEIRTLHPYPADPYETAHIAQAERAGGKLREANPRGKKAAIINWDAAIVINRGCVGCVVERCWIHNNEFSKPTISNPAESDKDGIVRFTGLKPGTYVIRETETLEGFTVTGEVIRVKLDAYYAVPEQMRRLVNYTTIQTGVHLAVTGIMWVGLAVMVTSGIVGLVRRRRRRNAS